MGHNTLHIIIALLAQKDPQPIQHFGLENINEISEQCLFSSTVAYLCRIRQCTPRVEHHNF